MDTHICDFTAPDGDAESARDLMYRYGLPEDIIDGVLALHAQELVARQREAHNVMRPHSHMGLPCSPHFDCHVSKVIDLIDPTRETSDASASTAEKAAAAGLTPTEYRAHRHHGAVEAIRMTAAGLYADAGVRVMAALDIGTQMRVARDRTERALQYGKIMRDWGLFDDVSNPKNTEEFVVNDLLAVPVPSGRKAVLHEAEVRLRKRAEELTRAAEQDPLHAVKSSTDVRHHAAGCWNAAADELDRMAGEGEQ